MFRRALAALALGLTTLIVAAPAAVAAGPSVSVGPVTINGVPGCC